MLSRLSPGEFDVVFSIIVEAFIGASWNNSGSGRITGTYTTRFWEGWAGRWGNLDALSG
jgi:hypothetical protein